jgi:hypothetical protein
MSDSAKSRPVILPAIPVAVALVACAAYANLAFAVHDSGNYRFFPPFQRNVNANDNGHLGAEYFNIAKAIVAGRGFADPFRDRTGPTAWMPPVLPAIEAGFLWIGGGDKDVVIAATVFLQTFALAVTGWLVLALAQSVTRLPPNLDGGLTAAVFLSAVFVNFHLWFQFTHDCWVILLAADGLLAGLMWFRPLASWKSSIGWGAYGGLTALISPVVGFAWGVLSLALAVRSPGRGRSRLALAILAAGLVLAPWTVRNYLVFGRLIPVKSNLAYELYQSQCLQPTGLIQASTFKTHPVANVQGSRREYKRLGEIAFLEEKAAEFRAAVWADPLDFLDRVANRLLGATIWYVPFDADEAAKRPWSSWISRLTHPLPFLGLLVVLLTATRTPLVPAQRVVIGVYACYLLPYVIVSYYDRYAVPLLAAKSLLVVWGIERLLPIRSRIRVSEPTKILRQSRQPQAAVARLRMGHSVRAFAMRRSAYFLLAAVTLGASAWFLFAGSRPKDTGTDLAQDFRGRQTPERPWQFAGDAAESFTRPEETGLRVTIPSGRTATAAHRNPVGVVLGDTVAGDFDISCGYEILQIELPQKGWGVGFELFVQSDTPTGEAFALERMLRPDGADVYLCSRNTSLNGKREFHTKHVPAAGTNGRLRLTRAGRELTAWSAEGGGDYRELGRYDLGPEALTTVRFAANPGVGLNAIDVRITAVKVHYDPTAVAAAPGWSVRWGWLARAESIGLGITLALLAVSAVVRWKWPTKFGRRIVAEEVEPIRRPRRVSRRGYAVAAIGCAVVLGVVGLIFAAPGPKPAELHDVWVHDFRGGKGPPEFLAFYGNRDAEFIKPEPEGLRISLPERYIHPWGGVGLQTGSPISGDFEITAAVEILRADVPLGGYGAGAALRVETASAAGPESATIARVLKAGNSQVAFWDHSVSLPGQDEPRTDSGAKVCTDAVGRLRLRRIGKTLHYLWAPSATGEEFQEIQRAEFGGDDITRIRLTALNGRQPCAVDVRLLDLQVRNGPATAGATKPHRWLGGAAMVLGIGLLLNLSRWLSRPVGTEGARP